MNMQEIPKIIHQIWSDKYRPLPKHLRILGETWKEHHPDWDYRFWDEKQMNRFLHEHYPQYVDIYESFQYDVQRWDAIRYLILDKIGGMYVDFDIECLKSHNRLIINKTCCFGEEPETHRKRFRKQIYFGNSLIACTPKHPFMQAIINIIFSYIPPVSTMDKMSSHFFRIMTTTGPLAIVDIYEQYTNKDQIHIIPARHVSPYTTTEAKRIRQGLDSEELDNKLKDAYSVHYFFGDWVLL